MKKILILFVALLLGGCADLFKGPVCHVSEVAEPKVTRSEVVGVVHFAHGSSKISARDEAKIREIARRALDENALVMVYGHASHRVATSDIVRRILVNMQISEERAVNVAKVMYSEGVKLDKVNTLALFDSRPLAKEDTPADEAQNRRAEIYLYWLK